MFLGRRRHSREERNGFVKEMSSSKQVVFDDMYCFWGGGGLPLLNLSTRPRLQFILGLHFTTACVLLSVCSLHQLHFTHSLHFTPGLQSAVCSPQSASPFYTDRYGNSSSIINSY